MPLIKVAKGKFVYPFVFEFKTFDERCGHICEAGVEHEGEFIPYWCSSNYQNDDLLPHVANYFGVEGKESLFNVGFWRIENNVLQSSNYGLGSGRIDGNISYTMNSPSGSIAFAITEVELFMFRTGMGAISFEVEVDLEEDQADIWFDFLHYFRFFNGQREVSLACTRATGFDQQTRTQVRVPFFPVIMGAAPQENQEERTFGEIIDGFLDLLSLRGESEPWWKDIFIPGVFLPYSILFLREVAPEKIPTYVYQFRKMFHSRQILIPTEAETSLDHPTLHPYVDNQWFAFSLDGGGFIAFDPPKHEFFDVALPAHLMEQYFLIFLMALHQRFVLTRLADEVARSWLISEQKGIHDSHDGMFGELQKIFLTSASLGNFKQIMQRDNLHQVYWKWQDIFQIDLLYESLNEEIQHINGYLQAKHDRRLEKQINILTLVLGIPAILFSFFELSGNTSYPFAALVLAGGLILGLVIFWITSRRK